MCGGVHGCGRRCIPGYRGPVTSSMWLLTAYRCHMQGSMVSTTVVEFTEKYWGKGVVLYRTGDGNIRGFTPGHLWITRKPLLMMRPMIYACEEVQHSNDEYHIFNRVAPLQLVGLNRVSHLHLCQM